MQKILIFALVIITLIISFALSKSILVYICIMAILFMYSYISIREYYLAKQEKKFIEEQIKIAKVNVFNTPNIIILIIKDLKVVWGNDQAYIEFTDLHRDRSINFLIENEEENLIKYNNKVYEILEKGSMYFLINITMNYRKENKLKNIQTIIGFFQIDNFAALEQSMSAEEYLDFTADFKKDIFTFFTENKFYFQEIDKNQFQLNIPYFYLETGLENRFSEIGTIIKTYHDRNIGVSTTMGIAYNYDTINETGRKAQEALELAISRGGAQIVVFNNEEKKYFGGGLTESDGSTRLRARIVGSTLLRLVEQDSCIYLISHRDPDQDAIASLLLMYQFLKKDDGMVKIIVDNQEVIEQYDLNELEFAEDIIINYVLDNTKHNILIALDTQSSDIISHPSILEDIEEIIVLDHHQTPKNYFRGNIFSWIDPSASSTVELIMSITLATNQTTKNNQINNLAISGILSDTNRFRYRIGTQTLEALMNLVELGGDFDMALEGMYLDRDMFLEKQKALTSATFINLFGVVELETETDDILLSIIADELLEIQGNTGSIVICKINNEDRYKVKIRTRGKVNAKRLIEEFNGGGHARQAAGILTEIQVEQLIGQINEIKGE